MRYPDCILGSIISQLKNHNVEYPYHTDNCNCVEEHIFMIRSYIREVGLLEKENKAVLDKLREILRSVADKP